MARRLLRDTCELAAEIEDGKHDENLVHIERAAQFRLKRKTAEAGIRKHARIRVIADDHRVKNREGTVLSVNQKTVSVELDPLEKDGWPESWRVPHEWLEVVDARQTVTLPV